MGLGANSCGTGPCGHDPVITTALRSVSTPAAVRFLAVDKGFVQESDGTLEECHPVDQRMAFGCLFRRGSIASDPTLGNTLHEIPDLCSPRLAREIDDRIRKAIPVAELLSNGDVQIDRIEHELHEHGSMVVHVYYTNLRATRERDRVIHYPA